MPNPYDELLGGNPDDDRPQSDPTPPPASDPVPEPVNLLDPRFQDVGIDPLDDILALVDQFDGRSREYARLLSQLGVMAHRADPPVTRLFLDKPDPHDRGNLTGERQLHELLTTKFHHIIGPMRELAALHLETVRRFNTDIDEHYFNPNKEEAAVESDKTRIVDSLNVQRRVLSDAAGNLEVLAGALKDTERRLKNYVNRGGADNISRAEYEMIVRGREELSSGREHNFDYPFFNLNLLDKAAIGLGVYLPETTAQYLRKLGQALNAR